MTDQRNRSFKPWRPLDGSASLNTPARFSDFYEQTYLPVFRYLYGLTGGPREDVEDLTAEAFTRAWRGRRSFQGDPGAALGWLMRIARHLVIDDYRRRKARPVTQGNIPIQVTAADPPPEESALQAEGDRLLWSRIRTLGRDAREMLTLRYLLGWRVNEIAAYLEIPENTVSVTIHRTLEQLRQQWPQLPED